MHDSAQNNAAEAIVSQPAQKKFPWTLIVFGLLIIAGFVGWQTFQKNRETPAVTEQDSSESEGRLPVQVVPAQLSPIQRWVTSPDGEVSVERFKQLIFESSGEVTYLAQKNGRYLREGDSVRKGQLLARIDDRSYRSDIKAAIADREVAKRSKDQAIASLRQSKANLEQAEADLELAKVEAKRRQALFDQGVIPATERDTYDNRLLQAQVGVKVAQENVRSADDQVAVSQASLEANQARLDSTVIAKEDTELIAPIDGVVAYLNIRDGEYWSPTRVQSISTYQDAVESVPIVVVDPNSFEVLLELSSSEGSLIRPNQRVLIALDDDISQAFVEGLNERSLVSVAKARGTVFSVTPAVTPGGRAVQVRIRITDGIENLRLGARVQAWIEAQSRSQAITLPFGAVISRGRKAYVFVVDRETQRVEQREVTLDIEGLDRISIARGLRPGELVVTEGGNRLVDNSPVEIVSRE
ncbi:MAG: HlyD family efflux transporter periplasmic adaptor subunit [Cyanobacteria bacterium P01_F01_bin.42]